MKKLLIALSFALSAPACMTAPSHDGTVESPQTSVEASSLATPRSVDPVCVQACEETYATCLDGAADDVAACNCNNARLICEHRCGLGGALHPCF